MNALPPHVREQLDTSGKASVELADAYLPWQETVEHVTSAATAQGGPNSCVLIVTERRLIFVGPGPLIIAWNLRTITNSDLKGGYFIVKGKEGEYSPSLDEEWGVAFEGRVKEAVGAAVLKGE